MLHVRSYVGRDECRKRTEPVLRVGGLDVYKYSLLPLLEDLAGQLSHTHSILPTTNQETSNLLNHSSLESLLKKSSTMACNCNSSGSCACANSGTCQCAQNCGCSSCPVKEISYPSDSLV
ncbi:hypothetical protein F5Y16DRAFT_213971 [Xylariaceae sp. FL0255]|nr:hypothetical protein F5Y16DRAFT_213971 [Xylariaceae sp. FL0255]